VRRYSEIKHLGDGKNQVRHLLQVFERGSERLQVIRENYVPSSVPHVMKGKIKFHWSSRNFQWYPQTFPTLYNEWLRHQIKAFFISQEQPNKGLRLF